MGADMVAVPKWSAVDSSILSGRCRDESGQAGTTQAQSSLLYIWEHWNGEGAWKLTQLPFRSSKKPLAVNSDI